MSKRIILKKENITNAIIIFLGIFCQISPLLSRTVIFFSIGLCGFILLLINNNVKKIKIGMGIRWYLLFVVYALFSLTYTINTINADYAVIRIATCAILAIFATQIIDFSKNFDKLLKGFIIGGYIGIVVVFFKQYNLIGVKRLGNEIYGSYVQFGNVIIIALYSIIWNINNNKINKSKKIFYFALMIIGFFAAMLSGTRKALALPILFFMFLQLLNSENNFNKKTKFMFIIRIVSILSLYLTLSNELLYSIIGNRIDSLLTSFMGGVSEDGSLQERTLFKDLAKEMFKEKPIFGYGLHGFAYMNYIRNGTLVYAHDTILEILSCLGIVGFILYFRVYYIILKNIKNIYATIKNNKIGLFFIAYVIITGIMEPFTMSYLSQATVTLLSCAAQYAIEAKYEKEKEKEKQQ